MQRWWCSEELAEANQEINKTKNFSAMKSDSTKKWTFKVLVSQSLNVHEKVALVGNCIELGSWDSDRSIMMNHESGE